MDTAFIVCLLALIMVVVSVTPRKEAYSANILNRSGQSILCKSSWSRESACGTSDVLVDRRINMQNDVNIGKRMFFGDRTMNKQPSGPNNTDPFFLEKVTPSGNRSFLRMTINDDADDSFQIWGDSCGQGNCWGEGAPQHMFYGNGSVEHKGPLQAMRLRADHPGWNWVHVFRNQNDQLFFGGDHINRGVWSEGNRPFAVYMHGKPRLVVSPNGKTSLLSGNEGPPQLCINNTCINEEQLKKLR